MNARLNLPEGPVAYTDDRTFEQRADDLAWFYSHRPEELIRAKDPEALMPLLQSLLDALAIPRQAFETQTDYRLRVFQRAIDARDSRLGDIVEAEVGE